MLKEICKKQTHRPSRVTTLVGKLFKYGTPGTVYNIHQAQNGKRLEQI